MTTPLYEWKRKGLALGKRERDAAALPWAIGDWWLQGEAYGERSQIVNAPDWTGPKYQTCKDNGWVAKRWPTSSRQDKLSFKHHKIVAGLSDEEAVPLLAWCLGTTPPRSTVELAARVKAAPKAQAPQEEPVWQGKTIPGQAKAAAREEEAPPKAEDDWQAEGPDWVFKAFSMTQEEFTACVLSIFNLLAAKVGSQELKDPFVAACCAAAMAATYPDEVSLKMLNTLLKPAGYVLMHDVGFEDELAVGTTYEEP
jgi:hypothetical protein